MKISDLRVGSIVLVEFDSSADPWQCLVLEVQQDDDDPQANWAEFFDLKMSVKFELNRLQIVETVRPASSVVWKFN